MKKIQKEIVKKEYSTTYVACDGTEFVSEEECKKYEESAKCVLFTKYNKLVVKETNAYSISGFGSDDYNIQVVHLKSTKDIDVILQLLVLSNSYYLTEDGKEYLSSYRKRMEAALNEDDFILIGRGDDYDPFCFEGTRNEHINVWKKLGKEEKTDEQPAE